MLRQILERGQTIERRHATQDGEELRAFKITCVVLQEVIGNKEPVACRRVRDHEFDDCFGCGEYHLFAIWWYKFMQKKG